LLKKILIIGALALAGAVPASASAAQFGLSTENPDVFRTVQGQMPVQYWSPFVGWRGADGWERYLTTAKSYHVRPFISWETWDARTRVAGGRKPRSPHGLSTKAIARGDQDKYIYEQVRAAKHYKRTIYVRLDHEMNGNWYPWSNGNAKDYVAMWKHVWNIFHRQHVRNVKWIWSPNLNTYESDAVFDARVKRYWPGAKYVDIIGATVTRVQVQGGTLVANDPNNGYYQGPGWFFQRLDRLAVFRGTKPFWITEALVDLEEMQAWMPGFRTEVDARPWIKVVNWLSTSGPQTPSFGNMNWALSQQPFARAYLTWKPGYKPPVQAVAATKQR